MGVRVRRRVGVRVRVSVRVRVTVAVRVSVGVRVRVGFRFSVRVSVRVRVGFRFSVRIRVSVRVSVSVSVRVLDSTHLLRDHPPRRGSMRRRHQHELALGHRLGLQPELGQQGACSHLAVHRRGPDAAHPHTLTLAFT